MQNREKKTGTEWMTSTVSPDGWHVTGPIFYYVNIYSLFFNNNHRITAPIARTRLLDRL